MARISKMSDYNEELEGYRMYHFIKHDRNGKRESYRPFAECPNCKNAFEF